MERVAWGKKCGKEGHEKGTSKGTGKEKGETQFYGQCCHCGMWGHTQNWCPRKEHPSETTKKGEERRKHMHATNRVEEEAGIQDQGLKSFEWYSRRVCVGFWGHGAPQSPLQTSQGQPLFSLTPSITRHRISMGIPTRRSPSVQAELKPSRPEGRSVWRVQGKSARRAVCSDSTEFRGPEPAGQDPGRLVRDRGPMNAWGRRNASTSNSEVRGADSHRIPSSQTWGRGFFNSPVAPTQGLVDRGPPHIPMRSLCSDCCV